ncbi:MAG: T9SS type A sorting domain-containing protein [Flavobacteriia bacterium]|nr:T9SS type A sorting domain-containing protein [Flavobacteriia bacterium]
MNKIGLKLLVVFIGINTWALSQCCPYITSVEVLPQNPNVSDNIRIATLVATPNNGAFIQHQCPWENDTLVVEACYYSGLLTVVTEMYDTIDVGTIADGNYVLEFRAFTSSDLNSCIITDSQTLFTSFSVTEFVGVVPIENPSSMIYPNPSKDWVTLLPVSEGSVIYVYSLDGKPVNVFQLLSNGKITLDLTGLSAGLYQVLEYIEGEIVSRTLLLKE